MMISKRVDLSSPQHTPAGFVVEALHYGRVLRDLLITDSEYVGCPHDGGVHSLSIYLSKKDLEAFFDLIDPLFKKNEKYEGGVEELRAKAFKTV